MSSELAQWYEDKASEMGISQSAMMVFGLHAYMETQTRVINELEVVQEEVQDNPSK